MLVLSVVTLTSCDNKSATPPALMKATTQFDTTKEREEHISYMRKHHMHALMHKRDDTVQEGIRTEQASLTGCINCHVPVAHEGKVLRHDDEKHFCTTCHTYVAVKINCFECHVDHPIENKVAHQAGEQKAFLKQALAQHQQQVLGKQAKRWGVHFVSQNNDKFKSHPIPKLAIVNTGELSE